MPHASANILSALQLRERFWNGDNEWIYGRMRAPRSIGDLMIAINRQRTRWLRQQAFSLMTHTGIDIHEGGTANSVLGGDRYTWDDEPENLSLQNYYVRVFSDAGLLCDAHGLTTLGITFIQKFIETHLVMVAGGEANISQVVRERTEEANRKVATAERLLEQQKRICETLRKDLAEAEKLLADNGIEKPEVCLNCGTAPIQMEQRFHKGRIGKYGMSQYANNHYITTEGRWALCDNPIMEQNAFEYKETDDFAYTPFANDYTFCGNAGEDSGIICKGCALEKKGMLTPQDPHKRERKPTGEYHNPYERGVVNSFYKYGIPKCCFCQRPGDCIAWNKQRFLVAPVLAEIIRLNTSPLAIMMGEGYSMPKPSMIRASKGLHTCELKVACVGIGGGGNEYGFNAAYEYGDRLEARPQQQVEEEVVRPPDAQVEEQLIDAPTSQYTPDNRGIRQSFNDTPYLRMGEYISVVNGSRWGIFNAGDSWIAEMTDGREIMTFSDMTPQEIGREIDDYIRSELSESEDSEDEELQSRLHMFNGQRYMLSRQVPIGDRLLDIYHASSDTTRPTHLGIMDGGYILGENDQNIIEQAQARNNPIDSSSSDSEDEAEVYTFRGTTYTEVLDVGRLIDDEYSVWETDGTFILTENGNVVATGHSLEQLWARAGI